MHDSIGQKDSGTTGSSISKSDYLNDSMECQQKCYENNTKHVKTGKQDVLLYLI